MHDPAVFEKPMEFMPERYMKDGKLNPNVRDPEAAAFGYGRRLVAQLVCEITALLVDPFSCSICPGRHMSNDVIFVLAASLLAVFDISPPKDESGNSKPMEFQPSSDVVS